MKKNRLNNKGFVLAETLVVTVFLMILFSMLYTNFYPLIGEYEKRENYDTVDGKYAVFWLKRMIEDKSYNLLASTEDNVNFDSRAYVRFECSDVSEIDEKRATCINLVKSLQIEGCDKNGDNCEIYITKYRIGDPKEEESNFKATVKDNLKKYEENCFSNQCRQKYISKCKGTKNLSDAECAEEADKKVFRSSFQDYVKSLPDYTIDSINGADYRVVTEIHNRKDNNNYYSYATIEVNRNSVMIESESNINACSIKYSANGGKLKDEHGADYSMSGSMILKEGMSVIHVALPGRTLPDGGLLDYNDASNINIEKLGYRIEPGAEWNTKSDGSGQTLNQTTTYTTEELCPNLASGNNKVTLYANWVKETYNINYNYNGGTVVTPNPTTYTVDDTIVLTNPTKPGYAFLGWSEGTSTQKQEYVSFGPGVIGDKTYTANFCIWHVSAPDSCYDTLSAAVAAANQNSTITLMTNSTENYGQIDINKNVTINLGNHTLDVKGNKIAITNNANVTMLGGANGKITGTDVPFWINANSSVDYSGMTINGCSVDHDTTPCRAVQVFGRLVMHSGLINSDYGSAIWVGNVGIANPTTQLTGTFHMLNGTLKANKDVANQSKIQYMSTIEVASNQKYNYGSGKEYTIFIENGTVERNLTKTIYNCCIKVIKGKFCKMGGTFNAQKPYCGGSNSSC